MNRHPYLVPASKMEMIDSSSRETMGGLDWIVVAVLITAGVLSAFSPWSFFMGGRFTPLAQWTGYGKVHATGSGDYGLFLRLAHHQSDDLAGNIASGPNLHGSAILCTPQGERYEFYVRGTVRNAFLQTEGRPTGLRLVTLDRSTDLRGVWRQGSLVLDDSGTLLGPSPDRAPKPRHGKRQARKADSKGIVVSFGNLSAFNHFCETEIARTGLTRTVSQLSPGQ